MGMPRTIAGIELFRKIMLPRAAKGTILSTSSPHAITRAHASEPRTATITNAAIFRFDFRSGSLSGFATSPRLIQSLYGT